MSVNVYENGQLKSIAGSSGVEVIDNLDSTDIDKALSANQGRILNENKLATDLENIDDVGIERIKEIAGGVLSQPDMDILMLGWSVPIDCPIKNYVDDNRVFHQLVGRVKVSDCIITLYDVSEGKLFRTIITNIKQATTSTYIPKVYLNGYITTSMSTRKDKTISQAPINDTVDILDNSYADVTAFKNAMLQQNAYVYYELDKEITFPVDGHEATTNQMISDEWSSGKTYALGDFAIYKNKLWKSKVTNNVGNIPAEGTYWTATNVGNEIKILSTINLVCPIAFYSGSHGWDNARATSLFDWLFANTNGTCEGMIKVNNGYNYYGQYGIYKSGDAKYGTITLNCPNAAHNTYVLTILALTVTVTKK